MHATEHARVVVHVDTESVCIRDHPQHLTRFLFPLDVRSVKPVANRSSYAI
jgi:hypothetical protein